MSVVTFSQKGWVVIPAELRRKYGWKPGDRVRVVDYGGVISLLPVLKDPVEEGWGALNRNWRGRGRSLTEALERARAEERQREERKRRGRP